jgi:hypothetical protein
MRSSRDSFLVDEGTGHDSARGCIDAARVMQLAVVVKTQLMSKTAREERKNSDVQMKEA